MASLIEDVLSIENQANQVVDKAHTDAKALEKSTQDDIQRIRTDLDAKTEERIAEYRRDAQKKLLAALDAEKDDAARRLAEIENMDPALIQKLAGSVVAEFRGR